MHALIHFFKRWLLNRNSIIFVANMVLSFIILEFSNLEPQIAKGLSLLCFIAILWLTEAVNVTITAIMVPFLAILLGIFPTKQALESFSNPVIYLFLGGFAMAAALHKQKLDQAIADLVLVAAKGKMSTAVFLLFAVTAVLSMWISNTATTAMMLPMALGLLSNLDRMKQRNTFVFVLLGIAYCASIGGIGTLVGSPPNAIAAAEVNLSFTDWMMFGLPMVVILLPITVGLLYFILKPNLDYNFELDHKPIEWNDERIVTLIIFLTTIFLWIFSKPISSLFGGIAKFDTVVALSAIVFLGVSRVIKWKDINDATQWGVLILFGGGICLSNALKATGTSMFLAHTLSSYLSNAGILLTLLSLVAFVVFLTEFASNTASSALLIPVFATIAEALNLSPVITSVIIAISASCAFMLPVATPPNAIVFGTGMIKQKEMMRVGIVLNIICIITITLFSWVIWKITGISI